MGIFCLINLIPFCFLFVLFCVEVRIKKGKKGKGERGPFERERKGRGAFEREREL